MDLVVSTSDISIRFSIRAYLSPAELLLASIAQNVHELLDRLQAVKSIIYLSLGLLIGTIVSHIQSGMFPRSV